MARLAAVVLALAVAGAANADFIGPYAPENWTFRDTAGDGQGELDELLMHIIGGTSGVPGITEYYITIPTDGPLSFNWTFQAWDSDGYDWCYYSLNGVQTTMTGASGGGYLVVPVFAGAEFALGVETQDGEYLPGEFWVSNFLPEPSTLGLLFFAAFALLGAKSRRPTS